MSEQFTLNVLTPEKELYSGKVVSLTANAMDGEIGILANHAPLITVLKKGRLEIKIPEGESKRFEIEQGLLKVSTNQVSVLIYQ
jgi:F-type H+-transporting ATPase subunit epsilon